MVTRGDRCNAELCADPSPEGLPDPFALPTDPLPGADEDAEAVRFCPLCLAELAMMGAIDLPDG